MSQIIVEYGAEAPGQCQQSQALDVDNKTVLSNTFNNHQHPREILEYVALDQLSDKEYESETDSVSAISTPPSPTYNTSTKDVVLDDAGGDDKFTLFPKLSIEIRLNIWNSSFERRHVGLDLREYECEEDGGVIIEPVPLPYIPATLAVNQESRRETLPKYFAVFIPRRLNGVHYRRRYSPGWINPTLDSIFFKVQLADREFEAYLDFFNHMATRLPNGLKDFRHLEIRDLWELDPCFIDREYKTKWFAEWISLFTGLKMVVLTGEYSWGYEIDDGALAVHKINTEKTLEGCKDRFDVGVAPVVRARHWQMDSAQIFEEGAIFEDWHVPE